MGGQKGKEGKVYWLHFSAMLTGGSQHQDQVPVRMVKAVLEGRYRELFKLPHV